VDFSVVSISETHKRKVKSVHTRPYAPAVNAPISEPISEPGGCYNSPMCSHLEESRGRP
jgi:hypothetical protein